jgi:hypothetical protein
VPNVLVAPAANTAAAPHVADIAAQGLNASVGTGQRSSPSIFCTPMYVGVPSMAAELNTVKVTHFSHRVT